MTDLELRSKCKQAINILKSIQDKLDYCAKRHEQSQAELEGRKVAA